MNKIMELMIYVRQKGCRDALARISQKYFSVNEFVLYKRDLQTGVTQTGDNPDVRYVAGDIAELEKFRLERPDLPREFYVDKTHNGKEFYFGYFKENLAQICWVFRRGEYSRFFSIEEETACELNYLVTLPEYRGNRFSSRIVDAICERLKAQNIRVVVFAISAKNVLMIRGIKSTGFRELRRVKSYFSFSPRTKV